MVQERQLDAYLWQQHWMDRRPRRCRSWCRRNNSRNLPVLHLKCKITQSLFSMHNFSHNTWITKLKLAKLQNIEGNKFELTLDRIWKSCGKICIVLIFTKQIAEFSYMQHFDVRGNICSVKIQKIGITRKWKERLGKLGLGKTIMESMKTRIAGQPVNYSTQIPLKLIQKYLIVCDLNIHTLDVQNDVVIESSELDSVAEVKVAVVLLDLELEGAGAGERDLQLQTFALVHHLVSNLLLQLGWLWKTQTHSNNPQVGGGGLNNYVEG